MKMVSRRAQFRGPPFRASPKVHPSGRADDANITRQLVVQFGEHAAVLNDVFIHFERDRAYSDALPRAEVLAVAGQSCWKTHFGGKARDEVAAAFERCSHHSS